MLPMYFSNKYPYTDFHELNLDWIINQLKIMSIELEKFVSLNTIKYADPIQWNITTQYETNTIVVDPNTGTAFISVQPVPSGVSISNTDYWSVIFTLDFDKSNNNITLRNDDSITATFSSDVGDWIIVSGELYKVNYSINVGDAYVPGSNITRYTVELFVKDYINDIINFIGDLNDLNTIDKTSIVNAINELVASILNVVNTVGDLNDLNTTDKTSIVNAINELTNDIKNITYPAANMISIDYLFSVTSLDSRYAPLNNHYYFGVCECICINNDGDIVGCFIDEQVNRTNDAYIKKFSIDGNLIGTYGPFTLGHANDICYANGFYYIAHSTDYPGGVETPSQIITKISADFSTAVDIIAPMRTGAVSYNEVDDVFYIGHNGYIYTFADDTFSTPINTLHLDEDVYNTTKYINMVRQTGIYYNGYWIEMYSQPNLQCWYNMESGKCEKVFNYPRRLESNGLSTGETESVAYNPNNDFFYGVCYSRMGEGDIQTNMFYKFSPTRNVAQGDSLWYVRNGIMFDIYVDPTISDIAYMTGQSAHPFKYLQFAVDMAKAHTNTIFTIHVKTSNNYLGCIRANNSNNFTIVLDTGYTADTVVTVPSIILMRCTNVGIFNMRCDDLEFQYGAGLNIADMTITNTVFLNRVTDADVESITCDTLHLQRSCVSVAALTYNTLTKTGLVTFKQANLSWFDGGAFDSGSVPANSYIDVPITFSTGGITGTPFIVLSQSLGGVTDPDVAMKTKVVLAGRTTTGFTARIFNNDSIAHGTSVHWIAFIKLS